ncbi:MAG: hypothetical protein Q9163_002639 [Psora crenata]
MQSGISVSKELHNAFNELVSSTSQRGLIATIQSESVILLHTIRASSPDFFSDLPSLTPLLSDKQAAYIILRRYQNAPDGYVAVTFVPDTAPVRQKTLFASTRLTLVRELGTERFRESLFVTDRQELEKEGWEKHDTSVAVEAPLTEAEEALKGVKEAESEARSGTEGRRLETGGTLSLAISEEAMAALKELRGAQGGTLVQLRVDTNTESIELVGVSETDPSGLATAISDTQPRYSLFTYRHCFDGVDESPLVFLSTCPSGLKVRERMLHASSKQGFLAGLGSNLGLEVSKKFEATSPSEITASTLEDEFRPRQEQKQGFSRPKRPASVVILPETDEEPQPLTPSLKRRQSSISEAGLKRPRLSQENSSNGRDGAAMGSPQSARENRLLDPKKSGHMQEERKRGQRLFGALLGTLSQSSSSTANKRRADIEKKQQAKLRLQMEEEDEMKKAKLHELVVMRRREQKIYDRRSMHIRHTNLLAHARFLRTKAEPRLYYKPWEFLPGEEDKIREQVREAEQIINRESSQFDMDHPSSPQEPPSDARREDDRGSTNIPQGGRETDGKNTDEDKAAESKTNAANSDDVLISDAQNRPPQRSESGKDTGDDGGEVVEDEEDTVIY